MFDLRGLRRSLIGLRPFPPFAPFFTHREKLNSGKFRSSCPPLLRHMRGGLTFDVKRVSAVISILTFAPRIFLVRFDSSGNWPLWEISKMHNSKTATPIAMPPRAGHGQFAPPNMWQTWKPCAPWGIFGEFSHDVGRFCQLGPLRKLKKFITAQRLELQTCQTPQIVGNTSGIGPQDTKRRPAPLGALGHLFPGLLENAPPPLAKWGWQIQVGPLQRVFGASHPAAKAWPQPQPSRGPAGANAKTPSRKFGRYIIELSTSPGFGPERKSVQSVGDPLPVNNPHRLSTFQPHPSTRFSLFLMNCPINPR